ncbi:MAG: cation:proton antiporter [Bacilli bacterium]
MNTFILLSDTASSTSGEPYQLLLPIALILLLSKIFGLGCRKINLPQVIGFLLAGVVVGLIYLIPGQSVFTDYTSNGITELAKFGVILIMFSAGVETDLRKIKAVGFASVVITTLGVIVPLLLGFLAAWLFMPDIGIYSQIYYGVILTATSVSISVATLKELGKLDSMAGQAIVSAAILDDIIGIVLLSLVISISGGTGATTYVSNAGLNILIIIAIMAAFFGLSIIAGIFIKKLFNWMDNKWAGHRRIQIFSLAICFLFAYIAEEFFGIADITGAYVAGLIISESCSECKTYIDTRTDTIGQTFFVPIFFASIALMMYSGDLGSFDVNFIWFGLVWVFFGVISKVIGAGLGAKLCKFKIKDSLRIGVGMMARAEVVIVCAQKGIDSGLVSTNIMPFALFLIILTSFLTPLFLKLLYKKDDKMPKVDLKTQGKEPTASSAK